MVLQTIDLLKWKAPHPPGSLHCHYLQPEAVLTYLHVLCTNICFITQAVSAGVTRQRSVTGNFLPLGLHFPTSKIESIFLPTSQPFVTVKVNRVFKDTQHHTSDIPLLLHLMYVSHEYQFSLPHLPHIPSEPSFVYWIIIIIGSRTV